MPIPYQAYIPTSQYKTAYGPSRQIMGWAIHDSLSSNMADMVVTDDTLTAVPEKKYCTTVPVPAASMLVYLSPTCMYDIEHPWRLRHSEQDDVLILSRRLYRELGLEGDRRPKPLTPLHLLRLLGSSSQSQRPSLFSPLLHYRKHETSPCCISVLY